MSALVLTLAGVIALFGAFQLVGAFRITRLRQFAPRHDWFWAASVGASGVAAFAWAFTLVRSYDGSLPETVAQFATVALMALSHFAWAFHLERIAAEERAAAQRALFAREFELTRATKLATLGELTAIVAHEINNPLQALRMNESMTELVLARASADPQVPLAVKRDLTRAADAARSNTAGLDRIRDLVALLTGASRAAPRAAEPSDLAFVVTDTLSMVREKAAVANVEIRADPRPTGPVRATPQEVGQIILNLAINAIKACQANQGGRVLLESHEADKHAVFRVHDTGPGIPPEIRDRLFDPFVTTKARGTGLGLSISRRLARELGGDLTFETRPEQGTTFTLTLPRSEASA